MNEILIAAATVGGLGLLFGFLLSFASIVFEVKHDDRIDKITEALPGANCGACGFAGCSAYAEAVVAGQAEVNCCSVGKAPVAKKIGEIMGVDAGDVIECTARVMCGGVIQSANRKYQYMGISDCVAASKLSGGAKECPYGCLGLGTCVKQCKFDAISIVDGVAIIDENKCQACGMCLKSCPKGIIEFVPKTNKEWVLCKNHDRGVLANKYCKVSCIGCKMCEKVCPVGAVTVNDNLAHIDYEKCISCGKCAEKCPRKIIVIKNPGTANSNAETPA